MTTTASPEHLLDFARRLIESEKLSLDETLAAVGAGELPEWTATSYNEHELPGLTDVIDNGMPVAARIEYDGKHLVIEAVLVVHDGRGLRTAAAVSGIAFSQHDVPALDALGGGLLVVASALDGPGELSLYDEEDEAMAIVFARCFGAAVLRGTLDLAGELRTWEAPEPAPAYRRPCPVCETFVMFPYSASAHEQVHLPEEGPGAPSGGACVDARLSAAIAAIWRSGYSTIAGCQGDDETERRGGYILLGEGEARALVRRLGAEEAVGDEEADAETVWIVGDSTRIFLDDRSIRFNGRDCDAVCAAITSGLAVDEGHVPND